MPNNENSTPEGVQTIANELNGILANFIRNNGRTVRYVTTEDGYSLISFNYGKCRVPEMKKIKEFIENAIYDELLTINEMPVTCIKVTDSVMLFKGKTSEVEEYISENSDDAIVSKISVKAKIASAEEKEEISELSDLISDIFYDFITSRTTVRLDTIKKAGISYNERDGVGYIGFDTTKVAKFVNENSLTGGNGEINDFTKVLGVYNFINKVNYFKTNVSKEFTKYIQSDEFKNSLDGEIVTLSDTKIEFSYKLEKYEESMTEEFIYKKTPGEISKMIVHYGNMKFNNATASDLVVEEKQYRYSEGETINNVLILKDNDGTVLGARLKTGENDTAEAYKAEWLEYFKKVSNDSTVLVTFVNNKKLVANDMDDIKNIIGSTIASKPELQEFIAYIVEGSHSGAASAIHNSVNELNGNDVNTVNNAENIFNFGSSDRVILPYGSDGVKPSLYKNGPSSMIGVLDNAFDEEDIKEAYEDNYSVINLDDFDKDSSSINTTCNIISSALKSGRAIDVYLFRNVLTDYSNNAQPNNFDNH